MLNERVKLVLPFRKMKEAFRSTQGRGQDRASGSTITSSRVSKKIHIVETALFPQYYTTINKVQDGWLLQSDNGVILSFSYVNFGFERKFYESKREFVSKINLRLRQLGIRDNVSLTGRR